ncbi:hypothetical protein Btru_001567 [Bulinus truncatus]|nr:hypothetical protein Btru_001567 [Bulinus truncatus]
MTEERRNKEELWLGIDIGTTSAKVVLLDLDGTTLAVQSSPTFSEATTSIGEKGNEQNPGQILKVVNQLVISLIKDTKYKIKGIGVTGQMHGVVFWTSGQELISSLDHVDRTAVSNLFTWQDQRCSDQFLETLPKTSLPVSTGFGCATMFWFARNHPHFFTEGAFTCCGTIIDFLVAVLCGLDHPVTSDQLATSFGYFNETVCGWSSVLHESKEFPSHLMPKVVAAGKKAGVVRSSLEGWPSAVPVFVGMGDVQCAMYAALKSAHHAEIHSHYVKDNFETLIYYPISDIKKKKKGNYLYCI